MPSFFDPEPADYEDAYIERILPEGAEDLWQRTIDESPVWDQLSPEQHMEAADLFTDSVFAGSLSEAEDFLDMLQVDWDDADISDFWDLYDANT